MAKTSALVIAAAALALGCGSESPTPKSPSHDSSGESADHHKEGGDKGGDDHSHDFGAEVTAFHDVMSPLWHAEPGEARTNGTCDAGEKLASGAKAIAAASVPDRAAAKSDQWTAAAAALIASVEHLGLVCSDVNKLGEFDGAFKDVHDKFHGLTALLGGDK